MAGGGADTRPPAVARSWWRPDGLVAVQTLVVVLTLVVAAVLHVKIAAGGPADDLRDGLTLCEALGGPVAHRGLWPCLRLS